MKIPNKFRAMKGERCTNLEELQPHYPLLATPKYDGIRAFTFEPNQYELSGNRIDLFSLTLTQIPNMLIRNNIREINIMGLDGELITYTDGVMDNYNTVQSKVMTSHSLPHFIYHVFDVVDLECNALSRAGILGNMTFPNFIRPVLPVLIRDEEHLLAYEAKCLEQGYEGVMLRNIDGIYKLGRSTIRQGHLIKLKRFLDAEATVIGFTELEHNENQATLDSRGLTERSDHKANKTKGGTLGALICTGHNGVQFNIGTGFTAEQRQNIWNQRENFKFGVVKYKYQPHGVKTAPRSPVFLGFRQPGDIA